MAFFPAPTSPVDVKVYVNDSSQISVSWSEPLSFVRSIDYYIIQYEIVGNDSAIFEIKLDTIDLVNGINVVLSAIFICLLSFGLFGLICFVDTYYAVKITCFHYSKLVDNIVEDGLLLSSTAFFPPWILVLFLGFSYCLPLVCPNLNYDRSKLLWIYLLIIYCSSRQSQCWMSCCNMQEVGSWSPARVPACCCCHGQIIQIVKIIINVLSVG